MRTYPASRIVGSFLATSLLLGVPVVVVAEGTASPQPQQGAPAQVQAISPNEPSFDLDFPGGSVADLLQAIEKATGHVPNVVLGQYADRLKIPPLKVRGITLAQLFDALKRAGVGFWNRDGGSLVAAWAVMAPSPYEGRTTMVRVFNIQPLLQTRDVKDIVAAAQVALEMDRGPEKDQPQMKYHKETQLLIVSGTPYQTGIVEEVLKALAASPKPVDAKDHVAPPVPKP